MLHVVCLIPGKMSNPAFEGFPPQFVTSLKILFDILDERKSGFVKLCDIESRWEDGTVDYLPSGVIECLKKIVSSDGELNFEQFVAGLRISLKQHRKERKPVAFSNNGKGYNSTQFFSSAALKGKVNVAQSQTHAASIVQSKSTEDFYLRTGGSYPSMEGRTWIPQTANHTSLGNELHVDYNKNRRPGDGRSSIASASALELMSKLLLFLHKT